MKRLKLRYALLTVSLALGISSLAPQGAKAFVPRRSSTGALLRWAGAPAGMLFTAHTDQASLEEAGVSETDFLTQAQDAVARWSDASSGLKASLQVSEGSGEGGIGWNQEQPSLNENAIVLMQTVLELPGDPMAATLLTFSSITGELLDADVLLNAKRWSFASLNAEGEARDGSGRPGEALMDLGSVLTHELGHALGLDHSLDETATMFAFLGAGEVWMRDLAEDDRAGIRSLYPRLAGATEPGKRPAATGAGAADPSDGAAGGVGPGISATRLGGCQSAGAHPVGGTAEAIFPLLLLLLLWLLARVDTRRKWVWQPAGAALLLIACLLMPSLAMAQALAAPTVALPSGARVAASPSPQTALQALDLRSEVMSVRVREVTSQWEGQHIVSTLTLDARECFSEHCSFSLQLKLPGGQVGSLVQEVVGLPRPAVGDLLLVAVEARLPPGPQQAPGEMASPAGPSSLRRQPRLPRLSGVWSLRELGDQLELKGGDGQPSLRLSPSALREQVSRNARTQVRRRSFQRGAR